MKGKLIVFEGTDGSGKTTQAQMLCRRLERESIPYHLIDFPRYGNPFAEPARLYLEGALGKAPGDVNAYAASTCLQWIVLRRIGRTGAPFTRRAG